MAQFGMFGMTPFDADALRNQEIMQSAENIEKLGPGYGAGVLAQQGIGQMFRSMGVRDKYDAQADKTNQVKEWLQRNLPENPDPIQYYEKMAEAFNRFGMPEQAAQVLAKIDELKSSAVDRKHKLADIGYKESMAQSSALKARADWAKALQDAKLKPSDIKTLAETVQNNPEMKDQLLKKYPEFSDIINNIHTGPGFSDPFVNQMGDLVQKRLTGKDKGQDVEVSRRTKINIDASTKFPETKHNIEYFERVSAKAEDAYREQTAGLAQMRQALPVLQDIRRKGVQNTGALAALKTEVGNILVSLGIDAGFLTDAVPEDQVWDSLVGDQVLAKMQQLGGNDSNEELREIRKMTLDRRKTPKALDKLLKVMESKLRYYQRIENLRMKGLSEGRIASYFNPLEGIWYPDRENKFGVLSIKDFSEQEINDIIKKYTQSDGSKPTREQAIKALRLYWGM